MKTQEYIIGGYKLVAQRSTIYYSIFYNPSTIYHCSMNFSVALHALKLVKSVLRAGYPTLLLVEGDQRLASIAYLMIGNPNLEIKSDNYNHRNMFSVK